MCCHVTFKWYQIAKRVILLQNNHHSTRTEKKKATNRARITTQGHVSGCSSALHVLLRSHLRNGGNPQCFASTTSLCCFGIWHCYKMRSGVAGGEVEGQVTGIFGLLKDKISPFVRAGKCQRGNTYTCPASRAEGRA